MSISIKLLLIPPNAPCCQSFANAILTALTGQHLSLKSQISNQLFQNSSLTILLPRIDEMPSYVYHVPGWHSTYHTLSCHCLFSVVVVVSHEHELPETTPYSVVYVSPSPCRATRSLQMINMYCWVTRG